MSTIKVETRIFNVGEMRADKLPEGTFVVYGGRVCEVHAAAFTEKKDELLFTLKEFLAATEVTHTMIIPRDTKFSVVKTALVRAETE